MDKNLTQKYIKHLNSIIQWFESRQNELGVIDDRTAHGIIARSRAAIETMTGKGSSYSQQFEQILQGKAGEFYQAELIIGVVEALRGDLLDGYLASFTELIHGEMFDDFLDMADFLLQEGYKDAAAVIAGSTLEAHLRKLCTKNGIDTEYSAGSKRGCPKPASLMNQDLGKGVYSLFDQKNVTAWLHLRNSAAHGKYSEYAKDQVKLFVEGLRDFIKRYPA